MSCRQSELTDCKPTTMTGTTACWVGDSWFWSCGGGIDVDGGEGEVLASDDDEGGSAVTDVDDIGVMVGLDTKPSEAAVDATGDVVVVAPAGCPKFAGS